MQILEHFNKVAIMETWLTNTNVDLYLFVNYNHTYKCIEGRNREGISSHVLTKHNFQVLNLLTRLSDDILESLFITANQKEVYMI